MKISIIVTVYKDILALDLVVKSLQEQTYKDFELIIAEDAQNQEMKDYVASIKNLDVKHTYQKDDGVRKPSSQNNAILASSGEYLIFIDGDCILAPQFIEAHVSLAEEDTVLSGRRFNLSPSKTQALIEKRIDVLKFVHNFWFYNIGQIFDRNSRFEQGIYINPKSTFNKLFLKSRKRNVSIIGCNFSCFKSVMLKMNGFDEDYGESGISDDMDLDWRFEEMGLKVKSCKNNANMFHLYHKSYPRTLDQCDLDRYYENQESKNYICIKGLNLHQENKLTTE